MQRTLPNRLGKKWQSSFFVVVVGLFICASVGLLISDNPESIERMSDDGLVSVTGTAPSAKTFYITSNVNDILTTYTLLPESSARQATLVLEYEGEDQFFSWDDSYGAWRVADATIDTQGRIRFASGNPQSLTLPNYDMWFEEQRQHAPEHAVAYEQFITYQVENSPAHYLYENDVRQFSCGEIFYRTRRVEEGQDVKDIRVAVDGVIRLVRLTLTTRWFINSFGDTCEFTSVE